MIKILFQEIQTTNFELVRSVLEVLSFAATVVLGILGIFVLYQLKLAKESLDTARKTLEVMNDDIQTRINREASVLAIEQVRRFGEEIIAKVGTEMDSCKELGLRLDPWPLLNKRFDNSSFSDLSVVDEWLGKVSSAKKFGIFTSILNDHESFAMYFVSGAADEGQAYSSAAAVFCSNISRLAPVLTALRYGVEAETKERITSGPFQNTIKLFEIWSSRMEKEDLETQKAMIIARSEGIHVTNIPILGTKKKD